MKILAAVALAALCCLGIAGAVLFLWLLYEILAPLFMFIVSV